MASLVLRRRQKCVIANCRVNNVCTDMIMESLPCTYGVLFLLTVKTTLNMITFCMMRPGRPYRVCQWPWTIIILRAKYWSTILVDRKGLSSPTFNTYYMLPSLLNVQCPFCGSYLSPSIPMDSKDPVWVNKSSYNLPLQLCCFDNRPATYHENQQHRWYDLYYIFLGQKLGTALLHVFCGILLILRDTHIQVLK